MNWLQCWRSYTWRWGRRTAVSVRERPCVVFGRASTGIFGSRPSREQTWAFFRDNSAFDEANDVLDSHLRVFKKQGELKATDHFPPISRPDLEKIGEFLRSSITEPMDPTDLTPAGWFVLTFFTLVFVDVKCSWICESRILRPSPAPQPTASVSVRGHSTFQGCTFNISYKWLSRASSLFPTPDFSCLRVLSELTYSNSNFPLFASLTVCIVIIFPPLDLSLRFFAWNQQNNCCSTCCRNKFDLLNSALTPGSADLRSADPVKAEFKRSLGMIGQ